MMLHFVQPSKLKTKKVPWEEVPELVAGQKVFTSRGYAYVAMNQVVSLVATLFRNQLSKIVEALCSSYLGPDFSRPREYAETSLKDIDQVAKSSFPLCMRHLFDKLREDHLLKLGGGFN